MKKIVFAVASLFATLAGCNAIIGTRDLYLGDAGAPGDGGATGDAIASRDGGDGAVSTCKEGDPSLQSDKANCGRCGHDCLGGDCTAGACKPVRISAETRVFGLALLDDKVYFTGNGSQAVYRMKKDGTEATKIAASSTPWGIAADKDAVYWVNNTFGAGADAGAAAGALFECKHATGCGPNGTYLAEASTPIDVAVFGNRVYFSENSGVSVTAYTKGAGTQTIASVGSPFKLATDGAHVYYLSAASNLNRVPVAGGTIELVGAAPGDLVGGGVFLGNGRVFWTSMSKTGAGTVRSASTATLADQTAYPNDGVQPFCITADAKNVYWGTLGAQDTVTGAVYSCPLTGCTKPTVLMSDLDRVEDVEVDDTGIYVALYTGGVFRLAKP